MLILSSFRLSFKMDSDSWTVNSLSNEYTLLARVYRDDKLLPGGIVGVYSVNFHLMTCI